MQEFYHNLTNTHIGLTKRMGTPAHGTYLSKGKYDDQSTGAGVLTMTKNKMFALVLRVIII